MNKEQNIGLNMKRIFTTLLLTMGLMMIAQVSNATHIVGGELSYRVLSGSGLSGYDVEITLIKRVDCINGLPGAFVDLGGAHLAVWDLDGRPTLFEGKYGLAILPNQPTIDTVYSVIGACGLADDPVCVMEVVYKKIFRGIRPAEGSDGYHLAYQRCCRNVTLENVDPDPLYVGMTMEITIPNEALTTKNHAPTFAEFPDIYACNGSPLVWDQSAVDQDGDELVYRLETPYTGGHITATDSCGAYLNPLLPPDFQDGPTVQPTDNFCSPPFELIQWRAPYNRLNMIPTVAGQELSIDANTGMMTAMPNQNGQFLIKMCIDEIRAGRVFNTTCREYEVNIRNCGEAATACATDLIDTQCDDLEVTFQNCSEGDAVHVFWDYGNSTAFDDISGQTTFSHTYGAYGTYTIAVAATNNTSGCSDTLFHTIELLDAGLSNSHGFDIEQTSCVDSIVVAFVDTSSSTAANITGIDWTITSSQGTVTDTSKRVELVFYQDEKLIVEHTITLDNGCVVTKTTNTLDLYILDHALEDTIEICQSRDNVIDLQTDPGASVVWTGDTDAITEYQQDGKVIVVNSDQLVDFRLYFTITNPFGCSIEDSVYLHSNELFVMDYEIINFDCESLVLQFNNLSDKPDGSVWDFGDGMTSDEVSPTHTYSAPGSYTITLTKDGELCVDEKTVTIQVGVDQSIVLEDTVRYCIDDEAFLNPGGDGSYTYSWTPVDNLDDPTSSNPKLNNNEAGTYFVVITQQRGEFECIHYDTVTAVFDGLDIDLTSGPSTQAVCAGDEAVLWADANDNATIEWFNLGGGAAIGTGDTLRVNTSSGDNYYVVTATMGECSESDTLHVMNMDEPEVNIELTSDNDMPCVGDTVMMMATVTPVGPDYMYDWSVPGTIVGDDSGDAIKFIIDNAGSVSLDVTAAGSCVGMGSTSIEVSAPTPIISVDPEIIEDENTEVTLDVTNGQDGWTYQWEGPGIQGDGTGKTITAIPGNTTDPSVYTVTVTDENGCTGTAQATVAPPDNQECDHPFVFLPNIFTPDNDGNNDVLCVRGTQVTSMQLLIYNRWGQKVFESNDQANCWDGTYEGDEVETDVYGYTLKATCDNGDEYYKQGNVTLTR